MNLKLSKMRSALILILFTMTFGCTKNNYFDKKVSANGWELYQVLDANNEIIVEKPDSINSEIYLVFTSDHRIVGHTPTQIISSTYTIKKDNVFVFGDLNINFLNLCCEWEEYFLDNYFLINKYSIDENENLLLFYENNKMIFLKN